MKVLLLDGCRDGDALTAEAVRGTSAALEARGCEVVVMAPRELDIAPCRGCFGCWTRTPGECVIRDDAADVIRGYLASDIVAYVTPVTFGGYSAELKKALDRIIPVLDPRFTRYHGEIHHRLRYDRYPDLLVVGTLPAPDADTEDVFRTLVERNGLNVHSAATRSVVVHEGESAESAVAAVLSRTEVAA